LPLECKYPKEKKTKCQSQASCPREQCKFHMEQNGVPREQKNPLRSKWSSPKTTFMRSKKIPQGQK
jgi:hypothetical protein